MQTNYDLTRELDGKDHDVVDLMRAFRHTDARRHVREETPFYTGERTNAVALIADLPWTAHYSALGPVVACAPQLVDGQRRVFQSASITRFCGCLLPRGSRAGRYAAMMLAMRGQRKQTWLFNASGSLSAASVTVLSSVGRTPVSGVPIVGSAAAFSHD